MLWNGAPIKWMELALPVGISFFTFESITYIVDVYKREHSPQKSFIDFLTYILLFPKLIAGPIVRYHEIAHQLKSREHSLDNFLNGFYRFSIGLAKKVLIANQVGLIANHYFFYDTSFLDSASAWIGILSYTFQLYFDFSGYSDMGIGLARMMGFRLPENFNSPYISQSITEFWRRWHITLGNWMRNYLYIPLGGNRTNSKIRLYFNLWMVFLLSGLWHGASWNFIAWGLFHGTFLVLERAFLHTLYQKLGAFIRVFLTFFIISIGWVIFRSEDMVQAIGYIERLFAFQFDWQQFCIWKHNFYLLLAAIFSFLAFFKFGQKIQATVFDEVTHPKKQVLQTIASLILLLLSLSYISASGFNPFIYFRF
ncbi:MAG: MBOAT family protein [Cytophagaceae bacterium]|nr:MBOAT family protein [Cytophagaceae bacterium]